MKKYTILILGIFFLSSCFSRYNSHFFSERNDSNTPAVGFGDFSSSGQIISFPNDSDEVFLQKAIENAKNTIWIEIYTFTKMDSLYSALVDAKNRGVDVRVLLEGNVYGTPSINAKTFSFFRENGIPVEYTSNRRYTFTHAKFWLIDDVYFISTGNWTKSFFSKNREYIYTDSDAITRDFLKKIFLKDFSHEAFVQISEIPDQIVISPLNSREKIENFIVKTENTIFLYVQTITDAHILELLQEAKKSGKNIFICTADNEANRAESEKFPENWKFAKNPYLHAKILIKDNAKIFLWSQNFTTNALENNREIGILLDNRPDLYEKFHTDIIRHCVD